MNDYYIEYARSLAAREFDKLLDAEHLRDFLAKFDEETRKKMIDVYWSAFFNGYIKPHYTNGELMGEFKKWEKYNTILIANLLKDFKYNYSDYIYIYYFFSCGIDEGRKGFGPRNNNLSFEGLKDKFRRSSKEILDKISCIIAAAFFEKEIEDEKYKKLVIDTIYNQVINYILDHLKYI